MSSTVRRILDTNMFSQGILLLVGLSALLEHAHASADEVRLLNDLLGRYNSMVCLSRPVQRYNETLKVQFGLSMIKINKVDDDTGDAEFVMWDKMSWNDSRLMWNPTAYGGITHITIPPEHIWTPDLVQYDSYHKNEVLEQALAVVYSNGYVLHIPPKIRHAGCSVVKSKRGNGRYQCEIKIGSWSVNGNMMDLDFFGDKAEIDVSDYVQSKKYKVVSNEAKRNVKHYACCVEPYISLTFKLVLKAI